ncbi:HpcH/HpaI aldolase/citrate lyase family protein [Streptomyces sp. NPDC002680]|uniref:HpcH/HpaI aldolase/citrate lyase family protein n=1 Tax=Streptomyces sp. NPDC002680 TaxID=3364659 RepID=UPI0036AD7179
MRAASGVPVGHSWIIAPAAGGAPFRTAQTLQADVALVDLEDSLAPELKQLGRERAEQIFTEPTAGAGTLGIRINPLTTVDGIRDLVAIERYVKKPEVILVPKVESAREVEVVAGCLDRAGHTPQIYALLETPKGIEKASCVAKAERLAGLFFGPGDFARLLGCGLDWDTLLYARSRVVASAAEAGLPALDGPFFDMEDLAGLRKEAEQGRALGFFGKMAVAPGQLPLITAVFRRT